MEYGLENFGSSLVGMLITLLIGFSFDFLLGSLLLWMLIFPLRKNAGGFHAETRSSCLLFSTVTLLVSIVCFTQIKWSTTEYLLIALCLFVFIFFMAPIENNNKHLDQIEYKIYQKRTRGILLAEATLLAMALIFNWKIVVIAITTNFFIVSISLFAGKLKLRIYSEQ